jgi:hypothetical protein
MGVKVFLDNDPTFYYTIRWEDGDSVVYEGDPKVGKKLDTFPSHTEASKFCNNLLKKHAGFRVAR